MGRPKKQKPEGKIKPIQIKPRTQEERDAYERNAEKAGLTLSAYINLKSIGKKPTEKDRRPTPEEKLRIQLVEDMQKVVKNSTALLEAQQAGYSIPDNPVNLVRLELAQILHRFDMTLNKSDISKPGSQS